MTRFLIIFLGALATVLMSYTALALLPSAQIASVEPTKAATNYNYMEARGRAIYMREGCIYCHTQQVRPEGFGSDIARGWGPRGSLPGDYVYDKTHLLGTMRTGPDLADIASRQPSQAWHLAHLYQPRSVSPGSVMPAYPYLFEVKQKTNVLPSETTVNISGPYAPTDGRVVVATEEALALYEYLMTLKIPPRDNGAQNAAQGAMP
ncbi:cbb3-type cytochrome c oxidase subunit II [Salisaeta longa]|uniref:cbb3-type cytochrome c oxidase subunit II n=1 Tax=Salisaeta longa TaxID=503170 RepID=UPI0003B7B1B8|nr:cbb3-type cytochrome c oxidase subunit II [Salisaeta longa]